MIHNTPSKGVLTLTLYNYRRSTDRLVMNSEVGVDLLLQEPINLICFY
jgi:hypothetical protein